MYFYKRFLTKKKLFLKNVFTKFYQKQKEYLSLLFTWRQIAKMKNSASTNLLILDEVFDASLDAVGCDEFLKLLGTLSQDTNVFVISHKGDILADKFRSVIRFDKIKNFSQMVAQ